jgi:hypothetical protein
VTRLGRLLVLATGVSALLLVATGCSPEDPAQRYVRERVAEHVAGLGGYDAGRTHCTSTPRPWFVERATEVYLCTGRRDDGDCDWFTARLEGRAVSVELDRPKAGCILPP